MELKINHIGYLIKKMDTGIEALLKLGFSEEQKIYDPIREAELCFMLKDGYCLELIAPSKESTLYPLLKKYKNTAYHICYEVDDLDAAVTFFEESGYYLFKEKEAAPAFGDNARVVFLMNPDIGMVELLQER